jgi:threonine dehydrogenase-like Zn-dependent dehydrogenase
VSGVSVGDVGVPVVRRASVKTQTRPDLLPFGQYTERGIVYEHGFSAPRWLDAPEHLFIVPSTLRQVAVLTEPVTVSEKGIHEALAIQQGRLGTGAWTEPPPRVLVTGLGPIAFAAVLGTVSRGWPTTMYGRDSADKFRPWLATSLGARYLQDSEANFTPRDVEADGYDLILECTGSEEVLVASARALAARGVAVWLGSTRRPQPKLLNVAQMMRDAVLRNHVHVGSVNAAARDFDSALECLQWWRTKNPRSLNSLITARVNQQEALWHYEHRPPQGIKTVIEYP